MSLTETLERTTDLPLEQSFPILAEALRDARVVVLLTEPPSADATSFNILSANDASGTPWIYAYSEPAEVAAAGLDGRHTMSEMPFRQLLELARYNRYGGIIIDAHKARGSYPILAEQFEWLATRFAQGPNGSPA